jgi:hypothetical protein
MFTELQTRFFQRFLPVGTIVASVLKPEQFVSGGVQPLWVLADGDPVPPESAYARITGQARVPDLRGLFLRGMNTMVEGRPRVDGYADPDTNRASGSLQDDEIQSHGHFLEMKVVGFRQGNGGDFASNLFNEAGFNTRQQPGVQPSGGSETRPKNIAVFYYVKIN